MGNYGANLVRRVLAFVLGVVFTIGALVGSIAGGAFWAYKNLKPLAIVTQPEDGLNDLRDQSIEELITLLSSAMENPDDYTFARLEAEYGLDLAKLLEGAGIEGVDTSSKNWEALLGISLFNAKDGIEPLLDSIKLRAIYNFLPTLVGKELNQILSKEAQEKLGDYSIMELVKSDETTGELGLIKAVRTLKLGALLPEFFNSKYDEAKHEYTYELNEENETAKSLPVLDLFGNVSLGVISNMMNGGDIMVELMDGSLSSITEMPIEEILTDILATASPELAEEIGGYLKALNGATIGDLFVPNSEGGYDFYYLGVLSEIEIGHLLGLTDEDGDGVWVNKEGEPAEELMQVLANLDLGKVIEEEDPVQMINELLGDLNVGMILDMAGIAEGEIPALDALRALEVGKLLAGQEEGFNVDTFIKALIANLQESFGDATLGEIIGIEETDNALLEGLFELRLADLVLEEYTLEAVVDAFENALGNVSIGAMLGFEKDENGAWICDDKFLAPILDFSFNNILGVLETDYSVEEIVKTLLPETSLGEFFAPALGLEYSEAEGAYYKETENGVEYLEAPVNELLNVKIADLVATLVSEESPVDVYEEIAGLRVGDMLDILTVAFGVEIEEFSKANGEFVWNNDPESTTSEILNSSLLLLAKDGLIGGEKATEKDVDAYFELLEDVINYVALKAGLEETVTPELVEDVILVLEQTFDGPVGELKESDIDWVEGAVSLAVVTAKNLLPEETPEVVTEVLNVLEEHVEAGTFENVPESLGNVEVGKYLDDLTRIAEKALPEQKELIDAVETLVNSVVSGPVNALEVGAGEVDNTIDALANVVKQFVEDDAVIDEYATLAKDILDGSLADPKVNGEALWNAIPADVQTAVIGGAAVGAVVLYFFANDTLVELVESVLPDAVLGDFIALPLGFEADYTFQGEQNELATALFEVKVSEFVDDDFSFSAQWNATASVANYVGILKALAYKYCVETLNLAFGEGVDVTPAVDAWLDGFAGLYGDAHMNDFVEATENLQVDLVIDYFVNVEVAFTEAVYKDAEYVAIEKEYYLAVGAFAKYVLYGQLKAVGIHKDALVDTAIELYFDVLALDLNGFGFDSLLVEIEVLLKDTFGGTLGAFEFDKTTYVTDLVHDVHEIANDFYGANATVDEVFITIEKLFNGITFGDFANGTSALRVDSIVGAVATIAEILLPEQADLINAIEVLVKDVIGGTVDNFGYHPTLGIDKLLTDVKAIVDILLAEPNAVLNAVFEELINLYTGSSISNFVTATTSLNVKDVINSVAKVITVAMPENGELIGAVQKLLTSVLAGTVSSPAINDALLVNDIIGGVQDIINSVTDPDYYEVNVITEELKELFAGVAVATFATDAGNIDVDELIDSVNTITDLFGDNEALNNIYNYAHMALYGPLNNLGVNAEGIWAEVPENVKPLIIGVAAGAAIVMYFVANDTLVELASQVIAEDAILGDYLAEPMGYAADYTFEGEANALASAIFNTKVIDVLDKDFDFKGAYYAELTVENVLGVAEAINAEYSISEVADVVLENLADLYGDTHIVDELAEKTKVLPVDSVIDFVADVANVISNEASIVNATAQLAKDILAGTLSDVGYHNGVLVETLVEDVNGIIDVYTDSVVVDAVLGAVAELYQGVQVGGVVVATKQMPVENIVNAIVKTVSTLSAENTELAGAVGVLVNNVIGGTVEGVNYKETTEVSTIVANVADIAEILLPAKANEIEAVENFANDILCGTLNSIALKDSQIEVAINDLADLVTTFTSDKYDGLVAELATLAKDVLDGPLSAVTLAQGTEIPVLVADVEDIVNDYTDSPVVAQAFAEIKELTADFTIYNTYGKIATLEIEKLVTSIVNVLEVAYPAKTEAITLAETFVKDLVSGTVSAPSIKDTQVEIIIKDVAEIVNLAAPGHETLVEEVAKLASDLLNGPLSAISFNSAIELPVLVADVEDIVNDYTDNAVVAQVFAEIKELTADFTVNNAYEKVAALEIEKFVTSIVNVLEVAYPAKAEAITVAETFVKDLVSGTVSAPSIKDTQVEIIIKDVAEIVNLAAPGHETLVEEVAKLASDLLNGPLSAISFNGAIEVPVLVHDIHDVVNDYVTDDKVNTIFAEVETLFAGVTVGGFVAEAGAIDVDTLINTINTITDLYIEEGSEVDGVVDTIYGYAHAVLYGPLNNMGVDGAEVWALIPENVQQYIVLGAGVGAGVLYFVANDTLVELVEGVLPDAVLGEFIAEPMGFEADYTFEGEENALASAIFNTKLVDIINDDFDFKGAYYDLLTVENIANIADALVVKYSDEATYDVLFEGVAKLYGDTHIIEEFEEATNNLDFDLVVDFYTSVIDTAVEHSANAEQIKRVIDSVALLVKDTFDGQLKEVGFQENTLVSDLIHDVHEIANEFYTESKLAEATFEKLEGYFAGITVGNFAEEAKELSLDELVGIVAALIVIVAPEAEIAVRDAQKLATDLFGETLGNLGYHPDLLVPVLSNDIYELVTNFVTSDILFVVNEVVVDLFNGVQLANVATADIIYDSIVSAVADIAIAIVPDATETIGKTEVLATYLIAGSTQTEFGIEKDALIGEAITLAKNIVLDVAPYVEVESVLDSLATLFANVHTTFEEIGELELDNIINTVDEIVDVCLVEEISAVEKIFEVAHAGLGGTINNPEFDAMGAFNLLPENVQTYVIIAGAVTGATLYVVANDTLVQIVEAAMPEAVLGEFIAEPMGFEADYTFEGEENALASAIFNTKLVDIVNDEFDFKGAYYAQLTVENVLGIGEAVHAKYATYEGNEIVNAAIEGLAGLYGDAHIVDGIEEATLKLTLADVVSFVADVVSVTTEENEVLVRDLENAINKVVAGSIEQPGYNGGANVGELITAMHEVVSNYVAYEVVDEIFVQLAELYSSATLDTFVEVSKNLSVESVVNAVAAVATVATDNDETASEVATLVNAVIGGTISAIGHHGDADLGELTALTYAVVDNFTADPVVEEIFTQVEGLVEGTTIATASELANIAINDAVNAVASVLVVALPEEFEATVHDTVALVNGVVGGTITAPGHYELADISGIVDNVYEIVNNFTANTVVETAFNQVSGLVEGIDIAHAEELANISINKAINAVAEVVAVATAPNAVLVKDVAGFANTLVKGTVTAPEFNFDANMGETVTAVHEILTNYVSYDVVDVAFEEVAGLVSHLTIGEYAKLEELNLDQIVDATANIVASAVDAEDTVYETAELVKAIFGGQLNGLGYHKDADLGELVTMVGAIVDNFTQAPVVETAFEEVAILYTNVVLDNIVNGTLNLLIDDVITAVEKVAVIAVPEAHKVTVTVVAEIARDLLDLTIGYAYIESDRAVKELVDGVHAIVANYTDNKVVNTAFAEISTLSEGLTLATIANVVNIETDDVINAVAEVVVAAVPAEAEAFVRNVAGLACNALGGTLGNFGYHPDAKVGKLLNNARSIAMSVGAPAVVLKAIDELADLYEKVRLDSVVEGTLALALEDVINAVAEVVVVATASNEVLVKDVAGFANTLVKGSVSAPDLNKQANIGALVTGVHEIVSNYVSYEVLDVAFEEVAGIVDHLTIETVDQIALVNLDEIINATANVVATVVDDDATVYEVAKLATDLFGAELNNLGYHDDLLVTDLVADVVAITDNFTDAPVVTAVADVLNTVYAGAQIKDIPTTDVKYDSIITLVANVAESFVEGETKETIQHAEDLAKYVVAGSVLTNFGFETNAFLGETIALAKEVVIDVAPYVEVNDVMDILANVFEEVHLVQPAEMADIVIDDAITAVNDIVDVFVKQEISAVEKIFEVAHAAFSGSFAEPGYHLDEAWNAVPETAKPYIIGAGVAVATGMYFFANDALVTVAQFAVQDKTLGEFIAEPAGFEADYTFEGEENALASAIFSTKVVDIVNDEFDFKGAYYALLTVEDILGIGEAVHAKYATYEGKEIVDTAIAGLADLYGDTHIVDEIKANTFNLALEDIVSYVADVTSVAFENNKVLVRDIETLVNEVIAGTIAQPGYNGEAEVSKVLSAIHEIVANFVAYDVVDKAFEQVEKLYEGVTIAGIKEGTLAIDVDAIIDAVAETVAVVTDDPTVVYEVATLAKEVLGGVVAQIGYHGEADLGTLVAQTYAIVDTFTTDKVVETIFSEVQGLVSGTAINTAANLANIEVDDVINAVAEVIVVAVPAEAEAFVRNVAGLACNAFGGTLGNFGYHPDAKVGKLLNNARSIAMSVGAPAVVLKAIDELADLYEKVRLDSVVEGTLALALDDVINAVAEVVVVAVPAQAEAFVRNVAGLACRIADGEIGKPSYHADVKVGVLVNNVRSIAISVGAPALAGKALEVVADLYANVALGNIVNGTFNLFVDDVITAVERVVEVAVPEAYKGAVAHSAELARDLFDLTFGHVYIEGDRAVSELIDDVNGIISTFTGRVVLTVIFEQASILTEGITLATLPKAGDILVIDVITAVANVVRAVQPSLDETLNESLDLINDVIGGSVTQPGYYGNVTIGNIITKAYAVADNYVANDTLRVACEQLAGLLSEVKISSFLADIANVGITDTVNAIKVTLDTIPGLNAQIARVYDILYITFGGTFGKPTVNFAGFWNSLQPTEQAILGAVAGVVFVGAYLVANEAVVAMTYDFLGTKTLGDLVATALGYTYDGENYSRNGAVNSLMNKLLNVPVFRLVNKDYAWAGLLEHVTLGNIVTAVEVVETAVEGVIPGTSEFAKKSEIEWTIHSNFENVLDIILNVSVADVLANKADLKAYALGLFEDLRIADFGVGADLGRLSTAYPVLEKYGFEITSEKLESGDWDFEGSFEKVLETLLNYSVGEIISIAQQGKTGVNTTLTSIMNALTVGDIVGETLMVIDNYGRNAGKTSLLNASYDEVSGKWTSTGGYADIIANFCNETLYDAVKGIENNPVEYLSSEHLLGNVYIGELVGPYNKYDAATDTWTNKGAPMTFGDGIIEMVKETLFELKVMEVISGDIDVMALLTDDLYIGDVLGYECSDSVYGGHIHTDACKWYKEELTYEEGVGSSYVKTEVDAITQKIASLSIGSLIDGSLDIMATVEGLSLGEIMGYAGITDAVTGETSYYNYKKQGDQFVVELDANGFGNKVADLSSPADNLTNAFADVTIGDITGGSGLSTLMTKVEGLYVGDVFQYEEGADGWYNGSTKVDGLIGKLCGYTIADLKNDFDTIINDFTLGDVIDTSGSTVLGLLDGVAIGDLTTEIEQLYVAQIMGYTRASDSDPWYKDADGDGAYDANEEIDNAVMAIVANYKVADFAADGFGDRLIDDITNELTLGDVIDTTGSSVLELLADVKIADLTTEIQTLKIGAIMGYEYDTVNGVWSKAGAPADGIIGIVAGYTIADLSASGFGDDLIDDITTTLTLGEIIDTTGSSVLELLADVKIADLTTEIQTLKIGAIMGYEYDSVNGVWAKAGAQADGIIGVVANYSIADLSDSNFGDRMIGDITSTLTLGEVINTSGSSVLALLDGVLLADLTTEIETLKIGEIMGYEYDSVNGTWAKAGVQAEDIIAVIANYSIADLSSANFADDLIDDIASTVKVSEFMAYDSCSLFKVFDEAEFNDMKIDELGGALSGAISKDSKIQVLVDIGLISASDLTQDRKDKIVLLYNMANPGSPKAWEAITIGDFFSVVFDLLD